MDPERYRQIKELLLEALERPLAEREDFLREACGDDHALLREVEELLAFEAEESFMAQSPVDLGISLDVAGDAAGQRLGRIRLERLLASGGMGEVYAGVDELLQRPVAVKLMKAELRMSALRRSAFLAEARVLSGLKHRNICQVHDFFEDRDQDVLVLELIDGQTLRSRLASGPPEDAIAIALQIADALVAAHESGIAHRDLKPENVMVTGNGAIKVLDFGLARRDRSIATERGAVSGEEPAGTQVAGTPGYLAPEQARGEAATTASDIWSFGLLLIELFTGHRPYPRGASSEELIARAERGEVTRPSGLPRAENRLLATMLAVEAHARPSARAVRDALRHIRERPTRRLRRGLAAAALTLAVVAGLKYTVDLREERERALAAQDRAEAARSEAEDLAGFMVIELYSELKKVGRLPLLEPVALKALDYYGDFGGDSGDEAARGGRGERALALIRVAEVLDIQGHLAEATDAYGRAVAGLEPLAVANPEDELVAYRLALAERNLGEVLRYGGDYAGGDPHAARAVAMARRLVEGLAPGTGPEVEPTGAERWSLLLRGLYLFADSQLRQGHADRAIELLDEAEALARPAVARDPALRRDLGDIQYKRCMAYFDSQRVDRVVAACEASFALDKALHEENPDDIRLRRNLMTAYWMLGRAQQQAGALEEALATTRIGTRIAREIAANEPANVESQNGIAVQLVSEGRILRALGRGESKAVLEEALGLTARILADGEDHAAIHNHVTALALLGRAEEARPYAQVLWDSGWRRPEFLGLIAEHDLLPGVDLATAAESAEGAP